MKEKAENFLLKIAKLFGYVCGAVVVLVEFIIGTVLPRIGLLLPFVLGILTAIWLFNR